MATVNQPSAGRVTAMMHVQSPQPQADGNGAVIVDLDEAIFGLNAMAREVFGIAKTGIGQAAAHWQAEAVSMGLDPMGWLSASAYESDWSAIASTIAVSAVSLPFAAMAIKGGIDEFRHGLAERQRLRHERQLLMARQKRAVQCGAVGAGATPASPADRPFGQSRLERVLAHNDAARLARIEGELRAANANISIGAAAASSGTLMSANGLSDMLLQPILKCCAKGMSVAAWIAQHAVWSAIVSVMGTIGALVLAPLAAISATWLGSSFVHRSRIRCRDFLRAKGLLTASMAGGGASAVANTQYGRFLTAKLGKRAAFMQKFRNRSIGFLSGASAYTGGVLVKTAVITAALFGFGLIASNPIVLLVLTVAMIAGAVVMAFGSLNFMLNLGRVKRHEGYERAVHPQLDRELLDALDPLARTEAAGAQPLAQRRGFLARANLFGHMVKQEARVQALVEGAAKACNKRYTWTDRSEGRNYREHRATTAPTSVAQDIAAAIGAAGAMMAALWSGRGPRTAWKAAAEHFATGRSALTRHTLARALAGTDPIKLHEQLCAIAGAQRDMLEARCVTRKPLVDDELLPGPGEVRSEASTQWGANQWKAYTTDLELIAQLQSFEHAPAAAAAASMQPEADVASAPRSPDRWFICRFLELQKQLGLCTHFTARNDRPDTGTQYAELADYLLSQAPQGFATLRGGLLACELDAARADAMPLAEAGATAQ